MLITPEMLEQTFEQAALTALAAFYLQFPELLFLQRSFVVAVLPLLFMVALKF